MRDSTFFFLFGVAITTALAIPTSLSTSSVVSGSNHGISERGAMSEDFMSLRVSTSLKEYTPSDWLSDVISAILGVNVGELLTTINTTLKKLSSLISLGVTQLQDIMKYVDANVKAEIQEIINVALGDALYIIAPIMEDLGLILPQITFKAASNTKDASDIISSLLGLSLEEFLTKVARAMEESDILLSSTMGKLFVIAEKVAKANPAIAADLHDTSDECLNAGKAVIRPVLDSLYQVLPSTIRKTSKDQVTPLIKNPIGLFGDFISTVLGFNVAEAGSELKQALKELKKIQIAYVKRLDEILINSTEIQFEGNAMLNKSIREIRGITHPVYNLLKQFDWESRAQRDIHSDIVESILGVSLEGFLNYVDFASYRIGEIIEEIVLDSQNLAARLGAFNVLSMKKLNEKSMEAAQEVIEPFLKQISKILPGDRVWVTPEEFLNHIDDMREAKNRNAKIFCDFSLIKGYNTNFIIDIISSIFGFDIVAAVEELEVAVQGLDHLIKSTWVELHEVLAKNGHYECLPQVNFIFQQATNDSQFTLMPILDIFVPFLPNEGRFKKDVVRSVIEATAGVSFEDFTNYVGFAARHFDEIIKTALLNVNQAVANTGPDNISVVDNILNEMLTLGGKIIHPFQKIVAPILSD